MHYITIPVWVFVIIVILASCMALILLFFFVLIMMVIFRPSYEQTDNNNDKDNYDSDTYELGFELKKDKQDETDKSES